MPFAGCEYTHVPDFLQNLQVEFDIPYHVPGYGGVGIQLRKPVLVVLYQFYQAQHQHSLTVLRYKFDRGVQVKNPLEQVPVHLYFDVPVMDIPGQVDELVRILEILGILPLSIFGGMLLEVELHVVNEVVDIFVEGQKS